MIERTFSSTSGRDGIFVEGARRDTSRQSAQLCILQTHVCRSTSRLYGDISATMFRPNDQNIPGKIAEQRPAGYTHGKAARSST